MTTHELLIKAQKAKKSTFSLTSEQKRNALKEISKSIKDSVEDILAANREDIINASSYVSAVMLDRLTLNNSRIDAICESILSVSKLGDPCGNVLEERLLASGIILQKVSVPIGVVAMIYESRPNVTCDAAALALMSGNVCVLRGGKEAILTNIALVKAIKAGLENAGITPDAVGLVEDTTRESSSELMKAVGYIDLLIPRGSAGLINACVENARVPCIQTGAGICHIYIDRYADIEKALAITENAKVSRPSVCNAAEVCLVHKDIAPDFLPQLDYLLRTERTANGKTPVRFILDEEASKYITGEKAGEKDFDTEFLDYILAIKIVDSTEQAIDHIDRHSTHHSECIVTENAAEAEKFVSAVDSAAVYVNASTRFTDGGEFGFGCEIGISTQKLHARGPMGLDALTSYKYILRGNGQTRW